jgi:hypothetical protein
MFDMVKFSKFRRDQARRTGDHHFLEGSPSYQMTRTMDEPRGPRCTDAKEAHDAPHLIS